MPTTTKNCNRNDAKSNLLSQTLLGLDHLET